MRRALVLLLLMVGGTAVADRLPVNLLARGKVERTLGGVDIDLEHGSRPKDLLDRLGKPETYKTTDPMDCGEIVWVKGGSRLQTEIGCGKVHAEDTTVAVEVSGTPSDLTRTGAGLNLGDTMDNVKRCYGTRFGRRGDQVRLQWEDETELRLTLRGGKIVRMMLVANLA